jgi:hypothetical protein
MRSTRQRLVPEAEVARKVTTEAKQLCSAFVGWVDGMRCQESDFAASVNSKENRFILR